MSGLTLSGLPFIPGVPSTSFLYLFSINLVEMPQGYKVLTCQPELCIRLTAHSKVRYSDPSQEILVYEFWGWDGPRNLKILGTGEMAQLLKEHLLLFQRT